MADEKLYVDEADGLKRVMNSKKLYAKLLTKFRTENSLEKLNSLLGAGDLPNAQIEAHTLKGVAGNLSFQELYKQCVEVETQIKAGAVAPPALEALNACFAETLNAVDQVLTRYA